MRMYDIIEKKRNGGALSDEEIRFFIDGYTRGDIPDYQAAAFAMAVYFRGMTDGETAALTLAMADSGDKVDLSALGEKTADKHSTGGVGDKTTLIVAPIAAALGCVVAKMSGRGLGHTGGTVDKLESIPGFRTELSADEFLRLAKENGICVAGQSGNLAPADKKLYALRDVTATVDSMPLIASSIMSKKLAAGSHCIVLDVKAGSGAFMKTVEDARLLSEKMVAIGKAAGRKMCAVITNMDMPLGHAIGNSLEVAEAVSVLCGKGPDDLREVAFTLAAKMHSLAFGADAEESMEKVKSAVSSGAALEKLALLARGQGGDSSYIYHPEKFARARYEIEIRSDRDGYISHMDAEKIGVASVILGAGREKKGDPIDHGAGIITVKKTGDKLSCGDVIAVLYTNAPEKAEEAKNLFANALTFSDEILKKQKLVFGTVE